MTSSGQQQIFLLCLAAQSFLDESYKSLFDSLGRAAQLKRAKTVNDAIQYLDNNSPNVILVTDEGLTETKNKPVLEKVQSYLQNGGLVIFGLHFPNFTPMGAFDNFFNEQFGLPWKHGAYHRSDFQLNPSCTLPTMVTKGSFPSAYSMKVLHVKDARPDERIFVPVPGAMKKSRVFPPDHVDQAQAAVAGAKFGNGFVVCAGDVNPGQESDQVILTLCGL